MAIRHATCVKCGTAITSGTRGATPKRCGSCKQKRVAKRRVPATCTLCGIEFAARRATKKFCTACEPAGRSMLARAAAKARHAHQQQQPRSCTVCGAAFSGSTPWAKFCGVECRREANRIRIAARAEAERVAPEPRDCLQCGEAYVHSQPQVVTCSRECKRERSKGLAQANARTCEHPDCDNPHIAKGLCHPHYRKAYPNKKRTVTEPCAVCGKPTTRVSDGPKRAAQYLPCCSGKCKSIVYHGLRTDLPNDHPAIWFGQSMRVAFANCKFCRNLFAHDARWPKAYCQIHDKESQPRFVSAQCAECGEWFVGDRQRSYGGRGTPHCSDACSKRRGRARRRALKRGAFVAPVVRRKVYEADGWCCHICGKKVKRNAKVPHPMAPTIDHVIPLAGGGSHEPSNCRTAHFMCNAIKSHRGGGEQMLLLAV